MLRHLQPYGLAFFFSYKISALASTKSPKNAAEIGLSERESCVCFCIGSLGLHGGKNAFGFSGKDLKAHFSVT